VYTAHSRNHHRLLSAQESIGITPVNAPDPSNPSHNVLLNIARSAAWLLDQTDLYSTPEGLHSRYLSLLIPLGYATYSGCIYAERLAEAFRARYDDGLLKRLHCAFSGSDPKKDGWLLRLVRRPKHAQHPLRHLLVLDFLETPAWSFFSLPEKLEFFGTGPWPCLNKAATHYGELVVTSCRVTHRGRSQRPVGTFECACGFVYSRTGPDGGPEDRYHIGKMKSFGPAWEARLEKLWNDESLCVSEIACRLGVDPLTIRRHAARLGLPSDQRGNRAAVKSSLLLKTRNTTPGKMK
jgi:hypothetical protein